MSIKQLMKPLDVGVGVEMLALITQGPTRPHARAGPRPKAQARFLEIWDPENLKFNKLKNKNSQNQNPCRPKYWQGLDL